MPAGRPSEYTPERGEAICELIANSDVGIHLLHDRHPEVVPTATTVFRWVTEHQDFRVKYELAKRIQAEYIVFAGQQKIDNCEPKGEGSMPSALVQKAKEQAQHRRWVASRLFPKRWGDRVEHELGEGAAASLANLVQRVNGSASSD